jgi:drug/metabolite transporter (DMT)-like permease
MTAVHNGQRISVATLYPQSAGNGTRGAWHVRGARACPRLAPNRRTAGRLDDPGDSVSAAALALILVSAGIHATWNLYAKRLPGGAEGVLVFTTIGAVVFAPIAAVVAVVSGFRPGAIDWLFLAGTGVLQTAYFTILRRGYAAGDLSVVYPLARGTGPLAAITLAMLLIGERPGGLTLAGAATITAGTILLATPFRGTGDHRTAVRLGVATGLIIGAYTAWDGYAVGRLGIPALVLIWFADAGRSLLLTPVALRRIETIRATWRSHRLEAASIGVLSTTSYLLVLLAMMIAPVSSVAPAREVSIVAGTLLGMIALGEPVGPRRLAASAVIATGVVLVALG